MDYDSFSIKCAQVSGEICYSKEMQWLLLKGRLVLLRLTEDRNSSKWFFEISRKMLVVHKIVLSRDRR